MRYADYLQSDEWKEKRNTRVLIDGKCSICGKPYNLQVHHLTYQNVPNEKKTDLITLCGSCHLKIEKMKYKPWSDSFSALNHLIQYQFCKDFEEQDLSGGGHLDFCKYDVIKKYLWPYMKEHSGNAENVSGCLIVQQYFRNRRYEIILNYYRHNYPENIVHNRTLFSRAMIKKVYEKPEQAERLINEEKEYLQKLNNTGGINND